jgi:hypothetical protein
MWMEFQDNSGSGGDSMKVARTFTIDLLVATELRDVKNQSAFVNAAVKARLAALANEQPELTWCWYKCSSCNYQVKDKIGEVHVYCREHSGSMIPIID